jgi:HD-GYP domain-containing protein (c-di-GMP phosphodiesterase class II)
MLSSRPYQADRTLHAAMEELYRCAGTQFDPTIVPYFCSCLE